jgi:rubrerythrin
MAGGRWSGPINPLRAGGKATRLGDHGSGMNGEALVDAVRESEATALERLGKEKALIAETDASLERGDVLRAAAAAEVRAEATFTAWAADETDETAREVFESVAETEAAHRERIETLLGESVADPDPDPLHEYLRGLESTAERVGAGLVGRPLAAERTLLQVVNFFVNEAENAAADEFRTIRSETQATVETGAEVLDAVCVGDGDWVRAQKAAEDAIGTAYDDYAETLTGMGLDPKPVC